MKTEALGSSHFWPKFKNKLDALNNISKKSESFLLKTYFPRKRTERIVFRPRPAVTVRNGPRLRWGHQKRHPLTNLTLRATGRRADPEASAACELSCAKCYRVSHGSAFLGACVLQHIKPKQWARSFPVPVGKVNVCMQTSRPWITHVRNFQWKTTISLYLSKVFIEVTKKSPFDPL